MSKPPSVEFSRILERVETIRARFEQLKAEVIDGGNDPEELALLDRVKAKLDELISKASAPSINVEVNVDVDASGDEEDNSAAGGSFEAWDARSSEYHAIIAKVVALKEEGHKAASTLEGYLHEIADALSEDRYDDALSQLDLLVQTYELVSGDAGDDSPAEPPQDDVPPGDVPTDETDDEDAAKAEWDKIEPQLERLREIVDKLTLEGHRAATSLFNQYSETLEARTEERWADAVRLLTAALELAQKVLDSLEDDDGPEDGPEAEDPAKKIWESMAGELAELETIIEELRGDEDPMWENFQSRHDEVIEARDDERWQDAVDLLQNAVALARRYMEQREDCDDDTPISVWSIDVVVNDPEGNPVQGADIKLSGSMDLRQRSDADGFTRFRIPGPGSFEIEATKDGKTSTKEKVEDEAPMNQNVRNVTLEIEVVPGMEIPPGEIPPGGVEDTYSYIKAIVQDEAGNPITDAGVEFDGPGGMSVPCNSKGEALFEVAGEAQYKVRAVSADQRSNEEIVDTTVPASDDTAEVVLVLAGGDVVDTVTWVIKAKVTDAEGNRASDVEVRVYAPNEMLTETAQNGEALFVASGSGRFMVQAFDGDAESNSEVVNKSDPQEGEVVDVDLQLQGGATEPFEAPTESGEPTIRKGDEDPDGWVEYLQKLLNEHLGGAGEPKISVSGTFDSATDQAVRWFQGATGCLVDGIVGNQTWSALREDAVRDEIGTDGREPGSHSETGAEARWSVESSRLAIYEESMDAMRFAIASTGTEPIDDFKADIFVDGNRQQIKIGAPASTDGGQAMHVLLVTRFRERYGDGPFQIEAYLPQELGGDQWSNTVEIGEGPEPEPERPEPEPDRPEPEPGGGGGTPEETVNWTITAIVNDSAGNPLGKAGVSFDGPIGLSGMTDSSGVCSHTVQGAGKYQVSAVYQGNESQTEIVEETAPADGVVREVVLTMQVPDGELTPPEDQTAWVLEAVVTDQDGNPIPNAVVEFDGPIGFTGMTDASGRISHRVQGPGRYVLHAESEDGESDDVVVDEQAPEEGKVHEVELVIELDSTEEDDDEDTADEDTDEDGNPWLANVEIEISSNMYGAFSISFDKNGKLNAGEIKKEIVGEELIGGADGIIGGGKVEITGSLTAKLVGNSIVLSSVLAASGSVMAGFGAAVPKKGWLGVGVEWSLKFANTKEILTYALDKSLLKNAARIIKEGGTPPTINAVFDLPANYILSAKNGVFAGGSASIGGGKISKTIKEYPKMLEVKLDSTSTSFSIEVIAYQGILDFLKDIAHMTSPVTMTVIEELLEIAQDPDKYVDDKRDKIEKVVDRVTGLPDELRDHFSDEIGFIEDLLN